MSEPDSATMPVLGHVSPLNASSGMSEAQGSPSNSVGQPQASGSAHLRDSTRKPMTAKRGGHSFFSRHRIHRRQNLVHTPPSACSENQRDETQTSTPWQVERYRENGPNTGPQKVMAAAGSLNNAMPQSQVPGTGDVLSPVATSRSAPTFPQTNLPSGTSGVNPSHSGLTAQLENKAAEFQQDFQNFIDSYYPCELEESRVPNAEDTFMPDQAHGVESESDYVPSDLASEDSPSDYSEHDSLQSSLARSHRPDTMWRRPDSGPQRTTAQLTDMDDGQARAMSSTLDESVRRPDPGYPSGSRGADIAKVQVTDHRTLPEGCARQTARMHTPPSEASSSSRQVPLAGPGCVGSLRGAAVDVSQPGVPSSTTPLVKPRPVIIDLTLSDDEGESSETEQGAGSPEPQIDHSSATLPRRTADSHDTSPDAQHLDAEKEFCFVQQTQRYRSRQNEQRNNPRCRDLAKIKKCGRPGARADDARNQARHGLCTNHLITSLHERSDEWYASKITEIASRPSRKAMWGQAARRDRWWRNHQRTSKFPDAVTESRPIRILVDLSRLPDDELPAEVRNNKAHMLALAWFRKCDEQRTARQTAAQASARQAQKFYASVTA